MTDTATPFTFERTVRWGDCDPAGIIYTPRVLDLVLEALEAWYRDVVGVSWIKLNFEMGMGVPTVRLETDFIRAPKPDQVLRLEVRVERLGRSSLTCVVTAVDAEGLHYFRAVLVGCFVARPDFTSTEIPSEFRERIAAYQAACGDT
jgi:4-hydroxybenzoyl-CoA thioesterase